MTKILMIPAPIIGRGNSIEPYIPYGLCSLQAVAKKYGVEVDILHVNDASVERKFQNSNELAEFLLDQVDLNNYDTVSLSTLCNGFHHSLNIAHLIKYRMPKMQIWFGGPHVSMVAKEAIRAFKDIDAVFVGEGESTFSEVMAQRIEKNLKLNNIDGIQTRDYKYIPRKPIANLDELPMIYHSKEYLECMSHHTNSKSEKEAPLEVTRGCPGICGFCSTRLYCGNIVRRKSDDRVILEMQNIFERTGVSNFTFIGDNFSFPRENMLKFCKKMIDSGFDFHWRCSLRINDLEIENLDTLWNAGCRGFFTGIESGSQETQKRVSKNVKLDHVIEVINKAIDMGFDIDTSFIIGFPWETLKDIDYTYNLHCKMLELGVKRSDIHILIPLLGTPIINDHKVKLDIGSYVRHDWMDLIQLDKSTQDLISQHPEMFLHLGYFENPHLDIIDLLATNDTARNLNSIYKL